MIIETALVELAKAGGTELFLSSSESLLKKVKTAKDIIRVNFLLIMKMMQINYLMIWPTCFQRRI